MISDENLAQLRALIVELLEEYGLKRVPSAAALRMRKMRERKRNGGRTKRNGFPSAQRNKSVTGGEQIVTEAIERIPLAAGGEFGVTKDYLAELERAYPAVDGPATLKEIRAWCISNPGLCKTRRGVTRFLNGWFQREQDKPHG